MLRIATIAVTTFGFAFVVLAQDDRPKGERKSLAAGEMRQMLGETVAIPDDFRKGAHAVADVLMYFADRKSPKGTRLPIYLDVDAFKANSEDDFNIAEATVRLPSGVREMTVRTALDDCLRQLPARAALILRNGRVEIVPENRARPDALLDQKVIVEFKDKLATEAIADLAELAGVTIVVDPRCVAAKQVVSLEMNNRQTVRSILTTWGDFFDWKVFVDAERVLVMPRAEYMKKIRNEAEEARLKATKANVEIRRDATKEPRKK